MRRKVRPFIMSNLLLFTSFCMSLLFVFFSNTSDTVLGLVIHSFVENSKLCLLIKKKFFNHRDNREQMSKILRGQFLMGHPLYILFFVMKKFFSLDKNDQIIFLVKNQIIQSIPYILFQKISK